MSLQSAGVLRLFTHLDCDVVLKMDQSVSRKHATLRVEEAAVRVEVERVMVVYDV